MCQIPQLRVPASVLYQCCVLYILNVLNTVKLLGIIFMSPAINVVFKTEL